MFKRTRTLEFLLFLSVFGLLAIIFSTGVRAVLAERSAARLVTEPQAGADGSQQDGAVVPEGVLSSTYPGRPPIGGPSAVIGQLLVPELRMKVPIISGIEAADLSRGVGHVPGTGFAGGLGNMAIAGHRDTFFRPLRNVAAGMHIILAGPNGSYTYQVDSTRIVKPEELGVLQIGDRPQVTLVTCYPFNFVGAAPLRMIVSAHLLSVVPSASPGN